MEIFRLLDNSSTVQAYRILDVKAWNAGSYIKMEITLVNDTYLYVREYNDEENRNYSFHWQDKNGELIARWDNSPHHKHKKETIIENFDISLKAVFAYIEKYL